MVVMDMPLYWRQAFPHTLALSVESEKAPSESHVTSKPG